MELFCDMSSHGSEEELLNARLVSGSFTWIAVGSLTLQVSQG